MDIEIIILNEVSQIKTNIIWYNSYVESKKKKMIQMNLFTKQKKNKTQQKQAYDYQRGKDV